MRVSPFLLVGLSKIRRMSLRLKTSIPGVGLSAYSLCVRSILSYTLAQCLCLSFLSHVEDLASAYTHKPLRVHDLRVLSFPTSINEPYAHSLSTPLIFPCLPPVVLFFSSIILVLSPKSYSVASAISFHAR